MKRTGSSPEIKYITNLPEGEYEFPFRHELVAISNGGFDHEVTEFTLSAE